MNRTYSWLPIVVVALTSTIGVGCEEEKPTTLAPTATALASSKAPATAEAKTYEIDKASSKVEFMMEAPQEKIRGRVAGATEGELSIDPTNITKTKGRINVDISGIELFQAVADDKGVFATETKSDKQNEHARAWLEISPDTPEDVRATNSKVQFVLSKIEGASANDITKMTGAERKVTFKATGDFLLHGRKVEKTAEMEATFKYEGDKLASVSLKTAKPLTIGLEEHDVKPREAFGKLAQKTLQALSPKVAKDALVSMEFTAKPGAGGKMGAPMAPSTAAASGAPSAGPSATPSATPSANPSATPSASPVAPK